MDAVLLVAALPLAAFAHQLLKAHTRLVLPLATGNELVTLGVVLVPLFVILLMAFDLYELDRGWSRTELFVGIFKVHFLVFVVITVLVFATQTILNRSLAALYLCATFAFLYLDRAIVLRWRSFRHAHGEGRRRLLLIGAPSPLMESFVANASKADFPPAFVGALTPRESQTAPLPGALMRLGAADELAVVLHKEAIDEVLFFPPFHHPDQVAALLDACETVGVRALFAVEMPKPSLASPRVVSEYAAPFIGFEVGERNPEALALKQALDVTAALVLLFVLSPLMLLCALGILVTMGRPVLFSQERAGLFGRTFRMLKFRTMAKDAEAQRERLAASNELSGPVFKMSADPRITPLGRFLRRYSLDELPQLFHVLTGTMSLVGPRPLPVKEQAEIRGWHRRRLAMRPGLTGLWQVSGRSDIDFEEWMKLDLEYVDHWSLGLDLRILFKTIPVVLLGRGAR